MPATLMRFTIDGPDGLRELAFDWAQELTGDDVWALDEMGVSTTELAAIIAKAEEIAEVRDDDRATVDLGLRAMCALAYLAHRRGGGDGTWREFARTFYPNSFTVLGMEDPHANRAERRAAAKRNGKAPRTSKVGEALAAATVDQGDAAAS